jgi:hypothetical protein
MTGMDANSEHSRHQLPFGAVLEQVSESLNRPEMRVHATSFENERLRKPLI